MGTNYYAYEGCCDKCGAPFEIHHIGKSSGGWQFHFSAESGKHSFKEWLEYLSQPNMIIKDEYNKTISLDEFRQLVEEKQKNPWNINAFRVCSNRPETQREIDYCQEYPQRWPRDHLNGREWNDEEGYSFYDGEFC